MQCETPSVVHKEQRTALFCTLMDGAHSELVADAVAGAHELGILPVGKLIGRFDALRPARLVQGAGGSVGDIVLV